MQTVLIFAITVLLSFATELIPAPRAPWRRPPLAVALHVLAVLFLCSCVMLVFARPLLAALFTLSWLVLQGVTSNAKLRTLREPMVYTDLSIFVQALRYPRFYLPTLGAPALTGVGVAVIVMALLCWVEPPAPIQRLGALLAILVCLALGQWMAARLPVTFDPEADQRRNGFLAMLAIGVLNSFRPSTSRAFRAVVESGPFADHGDERPASPATPAQAQSAADAAHVSPDVIVIQSESYFDARSVTSAINPAAYAQFDRACRESVAWGELTVPAWGANTMRTEFCFLTGLALQGLGYARFFPYFFVRRACASLAGWFKRRGYRTLVIHPYYANFFGRGRALRLLQFDQFLDIAHFEKAPHAGPYVADAAVVEAIIAALDKTPDRAPGFIFTITMENHGPLHLEPVDPGEAERYHTLGENRNFREFTIYLRHVVNMDAAIGNLLDHLQARSRPTVVCFYGDHVPQLSRQFQALGVMPKHSAYFVWRNFGTRPALRRDVPVEVLGSMVLGAMGEE